jgi:hypothetical protein
MLVAIMFDRRWQVAKRNAVAAISYQLGNMVAVS